MNLQFEVFSISIVILSSFHFPIVIQLVCQYLNKVYMVIQSFFISLLTGFIKNNI